MNPLKLTLIGTALISALTLTACQTSRAIPTAPHAQKADHSKHKHHRHHKAQHPKSHHTATACEGKQHGDTVTLNHNKKSPMQGTCQLTFKPDANQKNTLLTERHTKNKNEDRETRKAQREQIQTQRSQVCANKNAGDQVQLTINQQTVNGTCQFKFQPKKPA